VSTVIVVAGGDAVDTALVQPRLPVGATVIAADSGADHAAALGLSVDMLIGDLDSVSAAELARLEAAGVPVDRHPAAKDMTDLELALRAAVATGATEIVVVGGQGGRLDHFLANALLLAADAFAGVTVRALAGSARSWVVRDAVTIDGTPDELVSLLPVHGPARGIWTDGLAYPLRGEDLHPGTSRGVSNTLLGTNASIRLKSGVLLVVAPGQVGLESGGETTEG
jgi:thiamine pyrophosphokinase